MCEQVPALEDFAQEVQEAGYRHVVLLGMGGSSLGPEVLRQTFGGVDDYPELIVLDSTVPDWIHSVSETVEPAHTLFLISSKSGGTIETLSLYRYFRRLVENAVGQEKAGGNFVAITDPGTSLEQMAREKGFRRIFTNPPDIGGRYSVLSYFGMVPAALAGFNVGELLDRAERMKEASEACVSIEDNPGATLGTAMGTLALERRDKLTLTTSPSIASFGLWAEQLIAESTGKQGKGIIPVAGEPLMAPEHYGDDRLFVHVRLDGDENDSTDAAIADLESAGHPVLRIQLRDEFDLGAEFFRWEFATAVAGHLLGIQPFDQPNVQQAKDITGKLLEDYAASGHLPAVESADSLGQMLQQISQGDYLAIMPYTRQSPEMDQALAELRQKVMERYKIATTVGYGPRFLHSTGQLHKGGPNTGIFLQLTTNHPKDVDIPGQPYTFGVLADSQALGDLQTLSALGRRVVRVSIAGDDVGAVRQLIRDIA
jgi:glucose-6-phosphate isomerase/transaldolase/glucose-6-phosphate isomerase